MILKPGASIGKYRIIDRFTSGGMADLYLARAAGAAGFEKILLLKVLRPEMAGQKRFVDMLADEARINSGLDHENIVRTYDFAEQDDTRYLVLEYVQGLDLARLMDAMDGLGELVPRRFAVHIAMQVARGLDYAHNFKKGARPQMIVHRDINPHNVIVSRFGEVKILDFGIAKAKSRISRTRKGELKGKVLYMAPEQAFGREVDARTDIYALGMVLYELITGLPILTGDSDLEIIERARSPKIRPPSEFIRDLDPSLESIIMQCLEFEPTERFTTAADLEDRLHDYLVNRLEVIRAKDIQEWIEPIWSEVAPTILPERETAVMDESEIIREKPQSPIFSEGSKPVVPIFREEKKSKRPFLFALIGFLLVAAVAAFWLLDRSGAIPKQAAMESPWRLPDSIPAGHAVVQADPPLALVFAEGRLVGRSPVIIKTDENNVDVSATLAGHHGWSGKVNAAQDKGRFVEPGLPWAYAQIVFPDREGDYEVRIDGYFHDVSEGLVSVRPGLHLVEMTVPDSQEGQVKLMRLSPGQTRHFSVSETSGAESAGEN